VFERFTDQARQMMLTAQEEARLLQHDYVGTEHLLIAATEVDGGLPSALATLGLTTEALRSSVTRMVAPGGRDRPGELPFTAEASAALERSLREALQLGHGAIRPAHVVLGLLDVHDGTMPVLLTRHGVRAEVVRTAVLAFLDTEPLPGPAAGAAPHLPAPPPACPRCDAPITANLRIARLTVDHQPMRVAYCGICGAVVPVTFGP
jgi:ATP-dependent Clp protease ATP-binding subunit ClpA